MSEPSTIEEAIEMGTPPKRVCKGCGEKALEINRLRALLNERVPQPVYTDEIREVFDFWAATCRHPQAKLTQDRRAKVRARMREGYTLPDIKNAIIGASRGCYTDARGHRWDDLSLICRSGSNVERFIDMAGPSQDELAAKVLG